MNENNLINNTLLVLQLCGDITLYACFISCIIQYSEELPKQPRRSVLLFITEPQALEYGTNALQ